MKTCTNKVDCDQLHGSVSLKPWLKLNLMLLCAGTSLIPKSTPSFLSPAVWVKEQNAGWGLGIKGATMGLFILLQIEEKLRALREAKDEEDLMNKIRECAPDIANITQLATLRQNVREHAPSHYIVRTGQHNSMQERIRMGG